MAQTRGGPGVEGACTIGGHNKGKGRACLSTKAKTGHKVSCKANGGRRLVVNYGDCVVTWLRGLREERMLASWFITGNP